MITGTIAQGFIKVVVQGLAAAQAQLNSVAKNVQAVGQEALKVGTLATLSFGTATASIRELVRAADPYGFRQYEMAVARLNVQLGRTFIPLLREVTGLLGSVTVWLRGLSDSTREAVLALSKWTLVALGATAAVGTLGVFLSGVVGTFARLIPLALTLGKVLAGVFLASNPLGWVAGVAAALAALVAFGAAGFDLTTLWIGVQNAAGMAWEAIKVGWGQLAAFFEPLLAKLGGEFTDAWNRISKLVEGSLTKLQLPLALFGAKAQELLGGGLAVAGRLAAAGLDGLGRMVTWLADGLEAAWPLIERFGAAWLTYTTASIVGLQAAGRFVAEVWDGALDRLGQFISWCGRAFDAVSKLAANVADTVSTALSPVWPDMKAGFQSVGDYVVALFRRVVAAVNGFIDDMVNGVNGLIDRINQSFVGRNVTELPKIPVRPEPKQPQSIWKPGELEAAERKQRAEEAVESKQTPTRPVDPPPPLPPAELTKKLAGMSPWTAAEWLARNPQGTPPPPPAAAPAPPPAAPPPMDALTDAVRSLVGGVALLRPVEPKPAPGPADEPVTKAAPGFLDRLFERDARAKGGPPPDNRFTGRPLVEPKFLGIAEAMRAAQTATVPSPQQAAVEEILRTAKGIKDGVEKTARNTEKAEDAPFRLAF